MDHYNAESEARVAKYAYDRGYQLGEEYGLRQAHRFADRSFGGGLLAGFLIGGMAAWAVLGWVTP